MKRNLIMMWVLLGIASVKAQQTNHGYPVIGKTSPDFVLENVQNYLADRASLTDLNGRYVILDFWHRYCATCIGSFPKMEKLAEQFKDKLDVFMVGLEDEIGLDGLGQELKKRHGLNHLAMVYDSTLFNRFVPGKLAPHLILIDREGIVKAATTSVDQEMLAAFVNGDEFTFRDVSYEAQFDRVKYDPREPFLIDGNGGSGFEIRYRSMLLDYQEDRMPFKGFPSSFDVINQNNRKFIEGVASLLALYKMAYFGHSSWSNLSRDDSIYRTYYPEPIWEIADRSEFEPNYDSGKNLYWYSLILPKDKMDKERQMRAMQADLYSNFGYDVRVEVRDMPYWKVTVAQDAIDQLKSKGGKASWNHYDDVTVQKFTNYRFDEFIRHVTYKVYRKTFPILSEISLEDYRVDIDFHDSVGDDFEHIKRELGRHGIVLTACKRPYRVLIISLPN